MAIFRLIVSDSVIGITLHDDQTIEIISSVETVNESDDEESQLLDQLNEEYNLDDEDSDFEYEEITIFRVSRRLRNFEEILSVILDEAIDEFDMYKCAAAA